MSGSHLRRRDPGPGPRGSGGQLLRRRAANPVQAARRTWRADEDFYKGHYPSAPITPGVLLCESVFQTGALFMAKQALAAGAKPGEGVPLLAKISDVRFRSPIYPGDTILIEVKKKEVVGAFTMMTGAIKKADGTRVLTVEFAVAWKTPEGGAAAAQHQQQQQQ